MQKADHIDYDKDKKVPHLSFDALLKLEPEKYYRNSTVQNNKNVDFLESTQTIWEEAEKLSAEKKDQNQFTKGVLLYKELALKGHVSSMLALGNICQARQMFSQALRWNVLAFQTSWLFNGEHNVDALNNLNILMANKNAKKIADVKNFAKEFDPFIKIHVLHKNKDLEMIQLLRNLYHKNRIETYLNENDRELKASWLYHCYFENYATQQELLDEGKSLLKGENFDLSAYFFKKSNDPLALYLAGCLYREGTTGLRNEQPDYKEAARLFQISGTPDALYNLGYMYGEGMFGAKEGKPDFEEAAKWYQQSGTPEALCNLANLYRDGHIGLKDEKSNYEEAQKIYLQSQHPNALWNLGKMVRDGHLGAPNYELAAEYFKKSGHSNALCDLGTLYFKGKVGLLESGEPDYKTAEELYCTSQSFTSFANLSIMYFLGLSAKESKPNYQKAFVHIGLCESYHSKETSLKPDEYDKKMSIEIPYLKLMVVKYHYSEVAQFFKSIPQKEVIEQLCDKMSARLGSVEPSDQQFYRGIIAYYKDRAYDQALIHFNNALLHGEKRAQVYIELTQKRKNLEEQAKFSENLEKTLLEEEGITFDGKESTASQETYSISKEKEESIIEEKDSLSTLKIKDSDEQEKFKIERPKQYKPKSELTYSEKKKKLIDKINLLNKKIMSASHLIIETKDNADVLSPLKVHFLNETVEKDYQMLPKKIEELMSYIEEKPYGIEGTGKPEILKGKFKGHKGCISRRIDDENRLVYKVTGTREILILACQGHYK